MSLISRNLMTAAKTEEGLEKRNMLLCGALFFDLLLFMIKAPSSALLSHDKWPSWSTPAMRGEMQSFFLERLKKKGVQS